MVSCVVCATEESKIEMKDVADHVNCLDEHLDFHGLKRVKVPPDGHCIIHSWKKGLQQTSTEFECDLLHLGVTEILNNSDFYGEFLPSEDLRRQLEAYALLHNYHSAVVDLMVHALANATRTTCIILSAKDGEVRTTKISPREGVKSSNVIRLCKIGPHYDAVVDKSSTSLL